MCASLSRAQVHEWKLQEGNGGSIANDSIGTDTGTWVGNQKGNANGGTGSYYVTYGPPNLTYSGIFDGSTYITTSQNAGITASTPFSIVVWVVPGNITSTRSIVQTAPNSGNYDGVWFKFNTNYTLSFNLTTTNLHSEQITTNNPINLGQLSQLVAEYDGSQTAAGLKLYVNGSQVSTTNDSNTGFGSFTDRPWVIGSDGAYGIDFIGFISDVQIYNTALSANAVAALYTTPSYTWQSFNNFSWYLILDCLMSNTISISGGYLRLNDNYVSNACSNSGGSPFYTTKSYTASYYANFRPFLYGKFEVNAEMAGPTSDSTFWLYSTACGPLILDGQDFRECNNISDANYEEIDANEYIPDEWGTTTVKNQVYGPSGYSFSQSVTATTPSTNFHVYDIEWTASTISFIIDGTQVNTVSNAMSAPMYALFTNFTNYLSTPVPADYPTTMSVQYFTHWPLNGDGSCCSSTPDYTQSWAQVNYTVSISDNLSLSTLLSFPSYPISITDTSTESDSIGLSGSVKFNFAENSRFSDALLVAIGGQLQNYRELSISDNLVPNDSVSSYAAHQISLQENLVTTATTSFAGTKHYFESILENSRFSDAVSIAFYRAAFTSVSGVLSSPDGTYVGSFVRLELKNYGSNVPYFVVGTSRGIIDPSTKEFHADKNGNISFQIVGNNLITPSGTYYTITFFSHMNRYYTCNTYLNGGQVSLNNLTCF